MKAKNRCGRIGVEAGLFVPVLVPGKADLLPDKDWL